MINLRNNNPEDIGCGRHQSNYPLSFHISIRDSYDVCHIGLTKEQWLALGINVTPN